MEVRAEVFVEAVDSPELYDFLCGSGVVPEEEGVTLFLGIMDGLPGFDLEESRENGIEGGVGVWIAESLFSRLASVGLTVLAPNPEAWGIVDILREEPEVGMPVLPGVPSLLILGDLGDLGG
jgi:hypothetical protein